jgi:hypothetical protein
MFCPKCGLQNADGTKFCRGCGGDLRTVLAAFDKKPRTETSLAEKHIDLFSSGLRALTIGIGFLIVSGVAIAISERLAVMYLFFLAFSVYCLGTGISRLIHARGIKALAQKDGPAALTPGQADYIKPSRSIYETDDLVRPPSITEHTTTHLEMGPEDEAFPRTKK